MIHRALTGASKVVNIDRLLPYVTCPNDNSVVADYFLDHNAVNKSEFRCGDEYVDDDEHGVDVDIQCSDVYDRRQLMVESNALSEQPVTTHAKRHRRKSTRLDNYLSD